MTTQSTRQIKLSQKAEQRVVNACITEMQTRGNLFSSLLGQTFGGNRDVYNSMGYPKTLKFSDYYNMWRRNPIAKRVVRMMPNACWRLNPEIRDNESKDNTLFEQDVEDIINRCQLFKYLRKADIMAGIGWYGVLFLGFNDNKDFREPANGAMELSYVQAYNNGRANIESYDNDITSRRYGKPLMYQIDVGSNGQSIIKNVHWTRVIHIAEDAEDNDTFGTPRMEEVFNNLINIEYISASSAEGYWRGGFPGIALELNPDTPVEDSKLTTAASEMLNNYIDGFKRTLYGTGKFTTLQPNVLSPQDFFNLQIQEICTAKEIPTRIFIGSERGELASSQDATSWMELVDGRRKNFCETDILRPLIDRLIEIGTIEAPQDSNYDIIWPELQAADKKREAEILKIRTEALNMYANNMALQEIMPLQLYLRNFCGLSDDEIEIATKSYESMIQEQENEPIIEENQEDNSNDENM